MIEQLWRQYRDEGVISRAEHYAKFTAPYLMVNPADAKQGQATLQHDFQSTGSMLLNNLSAKLATLLFPSNQPFFKNSLSKELEAAAEKMGVSKDELTKKLSILEQDATENLFANASFAKLMRAVKLLIVTGQVLMYRDKEKQQFRVWSMHNFAVKRDAFGEWRCIVMKQSVTSADLNPNDLKALVIKPTADATFDLYTKIERVTVKKRVVVQVTTELDGKPIGEMATYPLNLCPWILPVWNLIDGEQYARGMVEEYAGDFAKLSILSEQLGYYELGSLQVLNLVNPATGSSVDDFANAESGDYITGQAGSITTHESGDYQKMGSVRAAIGEVANRLALAFMYTGNLRDAERITATEIRAQAKEAENTFGGAYSVLAETMQTPIAYLMMAEVSDEIMSGLIDKSFFPKIITGIPALNRNIEVQNIIAATQLAATAVPALTQLDNRIDPARLLDVIYSNHAVDTVAIFKTPEQMQQDALQKQQMAMAAQAADPTVLQNPNLQAL